jgi:hypothetical protein
MYMYGILILDGDYPLPYLCPYRTCATPAVIDMARMTIVPLTLSAPLGMGTLDATMKLCFHGRIGYRPHL